MRLYVLKTKLKKILYAVRGVHVLHIFEMKVPGDDVLIKYKERKEKKRK